MNTQMKYWSALLVAGTLATGCGKPELPVLDGPKEVIEGGYRQEFGSDKGKVWKDRETGLLVATVTVPPMAYKEARQRCRDLSKTIGYDAKVLFRFPSAKEAKSLFDHGLKDILGSAAGQRFWTLTKEDNRFSDQFLVLDGSDGSTRIRESGSVGRAAGLCVASPEPSALDNVYDLIDNTLPSQSLCERFLNDQVDYRRVDASVASQQLTWTRWACGGEPAFQGATTTQYRCVENAYREYRPRIIASTLYRCY